MFARLLQPGGELQDIDLRERLDDSDLGDAWAPLSQGSRLVDDNGID